MTFIKARSCILPKLQDLFASLLLHIYSPKICTHESQLTHKNSTKRVFSVATVTQTQPRTTYPEIYSSKLTSDQLYRLILQVVAVHHLPSTVCDVTVRSEPRQFMIGDSHKAGQQSL